MIADISKIILSKEIDTRSKKFQRFINGKFLINKYLKLDFQIGEKVKYGNRKYTIIAIDYDDCIFPCTLRQYDTPHHKYFLDKETFWFGIKGEKLKKIK